LASIFKNSINTDEMKKVLYIMRGEHTDSSCTEYENAQSRQSYRFHVELTCEIARRAGSMAYFSDSMTQEAADFLNNLVEKFAAGNSESEYARHWLREKSALLQGPEMAEQIEIFAALRREGIRISIMKTEDETDPSKLLEELARNDERYLQKYEVAKMCVDHDSDAFRMLYESPFFGPLLARERDKTIFQNVILESEDVNVLFMGQRHELEEFGKSDVFRIFPMNIMPSGTIIQVSGILPSGYRQFMDSLGKKYNAQTRMEWL